LEIKVNTEVSHPFLQAEYITICDVAVEIKQNHSSGWQTKPCYFQRVVAKWSTPKTSEVWALLEELKVWVSAPTWMPSTPT
jgi:hypothetical protein